MSAATEFVTPEPRGAALEETHAGHINGALGTILHDDAAPRTGSSPS